jgi:hypothetical protein
VSRPHRGPTRKQLALLHVARTRLGLSRELYEAILFTAGGVRSSRDLTPSGVRRALARMIELGFRQRPARPPPPSVAAFHLTCRADERRREE